VGSGFKSLGADITEKPRLSGVFSYPLAESRASSCNWRATYVQSGGPQRRPRRELTCCSGRGKGDSWQVTKIRRYEGYYDALNDGRSGSPRAPLHAPSSRVRPRTYQWVPLGRSKPPVWAWVQWPQRPAERIAAFASGWNDRVVIVEWSGPGGTRNAVVWRHAVRRRTIH
jgi:hypothetical protein